MRKSKSEAAYFVLSIILMALGAGVYIIWGNNRTNTKPSTQPSTTLTPSSDNQEALVSKAEALLVDLETAEQPTSEAVTNVQAAINKVTDGAEKDSLQDRLDLVSTEVANISAAESAVAAAESAKTIESLTTAQAAVNSLSNETAKTAFQARLDAVSTAITNSSATYSQPSIAYSENTTSDYISDTPVNY